MAKIQKREDKIELPFVDFNLPEESEEEIAERRSALGQDEPETDK